MSTPSVRAVATHRSTYSARITRPMSWPSTSVDKNGATSEV
jgi:hypothetical protein